MARKQRMSSSTGMYHVMVRGVEKRTLFQDDLDRKKYLRILAKAKEDNPVDILAWCLMPNHVHLLVMDQENNLSDFMHLLDGMYAQWFNNRWNRVGPLYQDRFKSIPVDSEEYLAVLTCYIHNNPAAAGIQSAEKYRWSSYKEYLGSPKICNTDTVLGLFGGKKGFANAIAIAGKEAGTERPQPTCRISIVTALTLFGYDADALLACPNSERADAINTLRNAGYTVRELADFFDIGRTTVCRLCAVA